MNGYNYNGFQGFNPFMNLNTANTMGYNCTNNGGYNNANAQTLIRVAGYAGAEAFQVPANSVVPLFDANKGLLYIKSTDSAGFTKDIQTYTITPIQAQTDPEYVTRQEFNELKEFIANGKSGIPKSESIPAKSNGSNSAN